MLVFEEEQGMGAGLESVQEYQDATAAKKMGFKTADIQTLKEIKLITLINESRLPGYTCHYIFPVYNLLDSSTLAMDTVINFLTKCLPCFPSLQNPTISVNGILFRIIRLLGQGGFSNVYLVYPTTSNTLLYAMKRISCPYGSHDATFANAMREVNCYNRFSAVNSPFVVKSIDTAIISEPSGAKTFCILLPYFQKSLQDTINYNILKNVVMDERELMEIFIGVLRGVRVLHKYKNTGRPENAEYGANPDTESFLLGDVEDDFPTDSTELEESCPYAHRDLKPANIMLSAEGLPVLVDFGSCVKARSTIKTRQQALTLTDFALEHCTLPYRAPELLDIQINSEITEATDIWSLGCVLYACCFGVSPFEKMEMDQGASLNLAIFRGQYEIPRDTKGFSEEIMALIRQCLNMDPTKRPDIDQLLEKCLRLVPN